MILEQQNLPLTPSEKSTHTPTESITVSPQAKASPFHNVGQYLLAVLRWSLIALVVGGFTGLVGGAFEKGLTFVSQTYTEQSFLLWLLPIGGLVIVFLYRICGLGEDPGTNAMFRCVQAQQPIPFRMAPLIFISTLITQLFGGSAGREGAALQLGGSLGAITGKLLRLNEKQKIIAVLAGMSGLFAALFGTPLTAAVFAIEVISVGRLYYAALLPCVLSAVTASGLSCGLIGNHPIHFALETIPHFSLMSVLQAAALGVIIAVVAIGFCLVMKYSHIYLKKWIKNPYLRVLAGSCAILLLTLLLQSRRYTGAGLGFVELFLSGTTPNWYDFLLKILFTAITIAAGFKGGEIVPTLFIGAAAGGFFGNLLGLSPTFGAAIGMIALFCGVVNCPLAAILLSVELFGAEGLWLFAVASAISYVLSGYFGLYSEQSFAYSKTKPEFIDRKAD